MANDLSLNRMVGSSADAARNRLLGMKSGVGTYRRVASTEQFSNHPKVDLSSHDTVSFKTLRFGGSLHPVAEKDATDRKNLTWRQKVLPIAGKVGVMLAASLVGGLLGGVVGAFLAATGAGAALTALGYQKVAKSEPAQTATPPAIWPQSQAAKKPESTTSQSLPADGSPAVVTPKIVTDVVADAANKANVDAQKAATKVADTAADSVAESEPASAETKSGSAKPAEKPAPTLVSASRSQSPFQQGKALTPAFGSLQAQIIRAAITNSAKHSPKMAGSEPQVDTRKSASKPAGTTFLPLAPVISQLANVTPTTSNPFQSILPESPSASPGQPTTLTPLPILNSPSEEAAKPQPEATPLASAPQAAQQPVSPRFGLVTAGMRFGRVERHQPVTPEKIASLKESAGVQALPLHNLEKPVGLLQLDLKNGRISFVSVDAGAKKPVILEHQIPLPKPHTEMPKAELLAT